MSPEQHPDQPRPAGDPQELEQLKAEILDRWRQLPSDEAAALMVEQLSDVLGSKLGVPLRQEQVEQLSDEDMEAIARIMEDAYVEASFWDDLEYAAAKLLEEKPEK